MKKPTKPASRVSIPWGSNPDLDNERRAIALAARFTLRKWREGGYDPRRWHAIEPEQPEAHGG